MKTNKPDILLDQLLIYLRKSRSDDPSMSVADVLASHERQLQDYAISTFGQAIPEEHIFREVVSGETIADRPVIQDVLQLIESENIRGVLVIEPQRLSRGDMEDCGRLVNLFRYSGTLVLTPMMTYDLNDDYDRKFFEMELTRGNDYLEYTKRILARGRLAAVKRGDYIGSIAPYGYRKITVGEGKDCHHTLEIVPEEAEAVKLIFHLYADEGLGFPSIAHRLDELGFVPRNSAHWNPPTLKGLLDNPVYIGKIRWNSRPYQKVVANGVVQKTRPWSAPEDVLLYPGKHPAIIDEVLFARAAQVRKNKPRVHRNSELSNPFAGLLFCSCGSAMSMKKYKSRRSSTGHVIISMVCNDQTFCHTKSVNYYALVERVVSVMRKAISDFEVELQNSCTGATAALDAQIHGLERDLSRLQEKDSRQKDAYENGIYTMDEYADRNAKLQEQIKKVRSAIEVAKSSVVPVVDYEGKILKFQTCINSLLDANVSAEEKNQLLKGCIEKITYHNDMPSRPGVGKYVQNVFDIDVDLKF